jgi:RHS repeat-associated protein
MESPRAETTATLTNTATYFYVWDQVGSIRLVTDGTGAVVVEHDYEPYGVEILPNAPTSMPTDALAGTHLYTGQERDGDTGLDNFHFRSYASTMGRFLSPDNLPGTPLNPQSFNLCAYVHGNPVNYNDPTGHWAGGLQNRDVSDLGGDDVVLSFAEDESGGGKSADPPLPLFGARGPCRLVEEAALTNGPVAKARRASPRHPQRWRWQKSAKRINIHQGGKPCR